MKRTGIVKLSKFDSLSVKIAARSSSPSVTTFDMFAPAQSVSPQLDKTVKTDQGGGILHRYRPLSHGRLDQFDGQDVRRYLAGRLRVRAWNRCRVRRKPM